MKRCEHINKLMAIAIGIFVTFAATVAHAQTWQPSRNVELIVGASPGGSFDITVRNMQRIFQDTGLVKASTTVVNRAGGNNSLSWAYMNQNQGDGHYLALVFPTVITNKLMGRNPITYTDLSPISLLYSDFLSIAVKADSPLKTAKDVVNALRKDPQSMSFGLTAVGTAHQIAVAELAKAAGVDPKLLKFVVFKGAGDATAAVLGGHVTAVVSSPATFVSHMQAGTVHVPFVTAPRRMEGALAGISTLKEQGFNIEVENWRGIAGPKGLSKEQVAYWEGVFAKLSESEEWKKLLGKYSWGINYKNSREFTKFLESQTGELGQAFSALGLAK